MVLSRPFPSVLRGSNEKERAASGGRTQEQSAVLLHDPLHQPNQTNRSASQSLLCQVEPDSITTFSHLASPTMDSAMECDNQM